MNLLMMKLQRIYDELLAELKDVFTTSIQAHPEKVQKLLDADAININSSKIKITKSINWLRSNFIRNTNNSDRNHHQDNQEDLDKLLDSKLRNL